ncbi:hypothetical protein PspLS_04482 [Pyricularia sp. CBS 133598]|nr:hypothetical protein PspLS_04482 [Pyricularia sp. CBS 133598]
MQFKSTVAFAAFTLIPAVYASGCQLEVDDSSGKAVTTACVDRGGASTPITAGDQKFNVRASSGCFFTSSDKPLGLTMKNIGNC